MGIPFLNWSRRNTRCRECGRLPLPQEKQCYCGYLFIKPQSPEIESWARICAVVGLLVFWIPVFGLFFISCAYWLTKKEHRYFRYVKSAFIAACVINGLMFGILLLGNLIIILTGH